MTGAPRSRPWYAEGLRFRCTRCGNCCRGDGNVWVGDAEILQLASLLEMTGSELRRAFTQSVADGTVVRQRANGDCVFWREQQGCTVYAARPRQCRTYPFWRANVHSKDGWQAESAMCPGIGDPGEGSLHRLDEMEASISDDGIPLDRTRLRVGD